jgi:hypothetical protein
MEEIWKPIPNFEDYQVSNFGKVKSLKWGKQKILKDRINRYGYLSVVLSDKKNPKNILIHQLVAMAFLRHIPDGTHKIVVDHINNIKSDNRLENLQLTTNRYNASKDTKGSSKYVGVSWDKDRNCWQVGIKFNKKRISLGRYKDEYEASCAYQKALSEINNGIDINVLYGRKNKLGIK